MRTDYRIGDKVKYEDKVCEVLDYVPDAPNSLWIRDSEGAEFYAYMSQLTLILDVGYPVK